MLGLVAIVIVIVIIAYLYFAGYISLPSTTTTTTTASAVPINVSASSSAQVSNLYPSQSFSVIANIVGNGVAPLNVSIIGYGCGGTTQPTKYVEVYPGSSYSSSWTFSAPTAGSCDVQFLSCFNDISYANYPITVENNTFTGTPPITLPSYSTAPVSVSLSGFNSIVTAPPSPLNRTLYIQAPVLSPGYLNNNVFNWLNIAVAGKAFTELPNAATLSIVDRNVNITNSTYPGILYVSGVFQFPLELTFSPVPQSPGFTTDTDVNVSVGYRYCLTSNLLPVSVS